MADPTDIVFRLRAENEELKAKLAESEADLRKVQASTEQVGETGEQTGAQLEEAFERAKESLEEFGEGINHVNDPLRGYGVAAEAAGTGTERLEKALGRLPGPAGQSVRQLNALRGVTAALPASLTATVGPVLGVVGGFEALFRATGKLKDLTESWHRTLEGGNAVLDGIIARLEFFNKVTLSVLPGFEESIAQLREYTKNQQDGTAALEADTEAREKHRKLVEELTLAVGGSTEALFQEAKALEAARAGLESTGALNDKVLERWKEQAGDLVERFEEIGAVVPASLAGYRKAAEETKVADTDLDEAHKELLDGLGEETEQATKKGAEALATYREAAKLTADDVARDAERLSEALARAEGADFPGTPVSDGSGQALQQKAEAKRAEVAALEEENRELVVTEDQVQKLAVARAELGAIEQELAQQGATFADERHEQAEREQVDLSQITSLTDNAMQRVLDLQARYGEAGRSASGELDALVNEWQAHVGIVGASSEAVASFGREFEAAFQRAEQQAQQHSAQIEKALQRQQTEAQATADDLADLNLQHDELAASAGGVGDALGEQAKKLEDVKAGAEGAAEGLGELGKQDLTPVVDQSKAIHTEWQAIVSLMKEAKTCAADLAGALA